MCSCEIRKVRKCYKHNCDSISSRDLIKWESLVSQTFLSTQRYKTRIAGSTKKKKNLLYIKALNIFYKDNQNINYISNLLKY